MKLKVLFFVIGAVAVFAWRSSYPASNSGETFTKNKVLNTGQRVEALAPSHDKVQFDKTKMIAEVSFGQNNSELNHEPKDFFRGLPSVADAKKEFMNLTAEELKDELQAVIKRIADGRWMERANHGELSESEQEELARLLHRESALRLAGIELKLSALEEKHL